MNETEYFFIVVSMSDVLEWGANDTHCRPNPHLCSVLTLLKVDLDLPALHDSYFDKVLVGRGDVHVYKECKASNSFIAFDLYKEPSDQLDLINISIRCTNSHQKDLRTAVRAFFDACRTKVCLEESKLSARVLDKIDPENYPRIIDVSNYRQKLIVHLAKG